MKKDTKKPNKTKNPKTSSNPSSKERKTENGKKNEKLNENTNNLENSAVRMPENNVAISDNLGKDKENAGKNMDEVKLTREMVLESMLMEEDEQEFAIKELQRLNQEEVEINLKKGLEHIRVSYTNLFINLININLNPNMTGRTEPTKISQIDKESIIKRGLKLTGDYHENMKCFKWLYQRMAQAFTEPFTYSQAENKINEEISDREQFRLHTLGFSDLEISWLTAWIIDSKLNRKEGDYLFNEFIFRNYINAENADKIEKQELDEGITETLKIITKEKMDIVFKVGALLKTNPLIAINTEIGIKYTKMCITSIKSLHQCNEQTNIEWHKQLLKTIMQYLGFFIIFLNFPYKISEEIIVGRNVISIKKDDELKEISRNYDDYMKLYENLIIEERKVEKENMDIECKVELNSVENIINYIIANMERDIKNKTIGGWRKILATIHLMSNEYYRLLKYENFRYIFKPNTQYNFDQDAKNIIKEIPERTKEIGVFDIIWRNFSYLLPPTLFERREQIYNEYLLLGSNNSYNIAAKYIKRAVFLLKDIVIVTPEEYDYLLLTFSTNGILSDFTGRTEFSLLKDKLYELNEFQKFDIPKQIGVLCGFEYVPDTWPSRKVQVSNIEIMAFYVSIYNYLIKNRGLYDNNTDKENEQYYNLMTEEKNENNTNEILSNTERCIQNSTLQSSEEITDNKGTFNTIVELVKNTTKEYYEGFENTNITKTIMANTIGMEELVGKENKENMIENECRVCNGFCNEICFTGAKPNSSKNNIRCPYYNVTDITYCIYCRELEKEHNIGYYKDFLDPNKKISTMGIKHYIDNCVIFKNKIQNYVDNYILITINRKQKFHILDCISNFILSNDNGIVSNLIKQNNQVIRITWELISIIYRAITRYIQTSLYAKLVQLGYNYDLGNIIVRPKNYSEIQSWLFYLIKNLGKYDFKTMKNIKTYLSTKGNTWENFILNQFESWQIILNMEFDTSYKIQIQEFYWTKADTNNILQIKLNDNERLRASLYETTKFIGNKRKLIDSWNNNKNNYETIGENTLFKINNLKLLSNKSKSNSKTHKTKHNQMKSIDEIIKLSNEKHDEYLKTMEIENLKQQNQQKLEDIKNLQKNIQELGN